MSRTALLVVFLSGLIAGLIAGVGLGILLSSDDDPAAASAGADDAPVPHLPSQGEIVGGGPNGGYVLALDPERYRLEVVHNHGWGTLGLYAYDADMEPIDLPKPPRLNLMFDDGSVQAEPTRENWDGDEDGGWHFEHDALLDPPEVGRIHVVLGDRTYTPEFRHVHAPGSEEDPNHTHALVDPAAE